MFQYKGAKSQQNYNVDDKNRTKLKEKKNNHPLKKIHQNVSQSVVGAVCRTVAHDKVNFDEPFFSSF